MNESTEELEVDDEEARAARVAQRRERLAAISKLHSEWSQKHADAPESWNQESSGVLGPDYPNHHLDVEARGAVAADFFDEADRIWNGEAEEAPSGAGKDSGAKGSEKDRGVKRDADGSGGPKTG